MWTCHNISEMQLTPFSFSLAGLVDQFVKAVDHTSWSWMDWWIDLPLVQITCACETCTGQCKKGHYWAHRKTAPSISNCRCNRWTCLPRRSGLKSLRRCASETGSPLISREMLQKFPTPKWWGWEGFLKWSIKQATNATHLDESP